MADARLVIRNLNKSYAVPVLTDLSLAIASGEVHAIVGENGAGKSTLVNILTGLTRRDSGELLLDDQAYEPAGARDAFAAGVSFAAQELTAIETLSVAENFGLRNLPATRGVIDRQALRQQAAGALRQVGLTSVTPDTPVSKLGISDRQLLELAKALAGDSRLLILDEPTAALTSPQADRLHTLLRERAESGTTIIYISHRLDDVLDVADTVSVLRDGKLVMTAPASSQSVDTLVHAMAGDAFRMAAQPVDPGAAGPLLIRADGITTTALPHPLSVAGYTGEIIGIAGLAGAGRSELLQALFGLVPLTGGEVIRAADGVELPVSSATNAVRAGIAFLGEDRQAMGLFKGQSVTTNMMIPGDAMRRSGFKLIDRQSERSAARSLEQKLDLRCRDLGQDIAELSGGNQQKALIGRWLHCDSDVFLLDEPTRGVDINTKGAIYEMLASMRQDGKCIFIASSEIEELMTVCTRILVLSSRKLVREFKRGNWSQTDILSAAFEGHTAGTMH